MAPKSHVLGCVLAAVGLVLGVGAVGVLSPNASPPAKELVALRWTQNHSCREDCFAFFVERQGGVPCFSGEYVRKETQTERNPKDLPLSEPQWGQLETYLSTHTFSPSVEAHARPDGLRRHRELSDHHVATGRTDGDGGMGRPRCMGAAWAFDRPGGGRLETTNQGICPVLAGQRNIKV